MIQFYKYSLIINCIFFFFLLEIVADFVDGFGEKLAHFCLGLHGPLETFRKTSLLVYLQGDLLVILYALI